MAVESKPTKEIKPVFGPGIPEEESLGKLCEVVKETEKKLIENNLVNKKHLSDRSFVLFDPEPFLDDSDQYTKFSPEELKDILKKFNLENEKNGSDEKFLSSEICIPINEIKKEPSNDIDVCLNNDLSDQTNSINEKTCDTQIDQQSECQYAPQNDCKEQLLTDKVCSENVFSNESFSVDDNKIHKNTKQQPRFSNIFDLFQVPDFSDLIPSKCENPDYCSTNEQLAKKEESNEMSMVSEKYIEDEQCAEEEEEEPEEQCDEEEEDVVEENEIWYTDEEFQMEENESFHDDFEVENSSFDESVVNESSSSDEITYDIISSHSENDENNRKLRTERSYKLTQKNSFSQHMQQNDMESQKVINETNDDDQSLDYDVLNNWYQQWRQQMHFIQTLVKMSK